MAADVRRWLGCSWLAGCRLSRLATLAMPGSPGGRGVLLAMWLAGSVAGWLVAGRVNGSVGGWLAAGPLVAGMLLRGWSAGWVQSQSQMRSLGGLTSGGWRAQQTPSVMCCGCWRRAGCYRSHLTKAAGASGDTGGRKTPAYGRSSERS